MLVLKFGGLRGVRAGFREAVTDSLDFVTERTGAGEGAIGPESRLLTQAAWLNLKTADRRFKAQQHDQGRATPLATSLRCIGSSQIDMRSRSCRGARYAPYWARKRSCKQTRTEERNTEDRKMGLLTLEENRFGDVFLHVAMTEPFTGPATNSLHKSDLEYGDISYIAWAYERDVPRTGFAAGLASDIVPLLPWPNGQS
jgi:hypothetical protein